MEEKNPSRMVESIAKVAISSGEEILNAEKAGKLYGISKWAMYKRAEKGMAPFHKIGKKIYFFRSELVDDLLNSDP